MKSSKYSYHVLWSEEDLEYIGLCSEFPSLSWLSPYAAEALEGIINLVQESIDDMQENGEDIPIPIPSELLKKPLSSSIELSLI